MENELLICWNCLERTPVGVCVNCGSEVRKSGSMDKEKKSTTYDYIVQTKRRSGEKIEFRLEELRKILNNHFTVVEQIFDAGPIFLVKRESEKDDLDGKYEEINKECQTIVEGLTPVFVDPSLHLRFRKIPMLSQSDLLLIVEFIIKDMPKEQEQAFSRPFFVLSLISITIAGLFTVIRRKLALTGVDSYFIFDFSIYEKLTLNDLFLLFTFVVTMTTLILIRIGITLWVNRREKAPPFKIFVLPTPIPYFELGTLGDIKIEYTPHTTRKSFFNTSFIAPVVSWIVALVVFLASLPLSVYDTNAADLYAQNSLVSSGKYEPLVFWVTELILKSTGYNNGFFTGVVFHPIGLASLVILYISGFHLLPLSQLNGGALIEIKFGRTISYIASVLTVAALFGLGLVWLGILSFFLFRLTSRTIILNEYSSLPKFSTFKLILALVVGVLTIPIPIF